MSNPYISYRITQSHFGKHVVYAIKMDGSLYVCRDENADPILYDTIEDAQEFIVGRMRDIPKSQMAGDFFIHWKFEEQDDE